MKIYLNGFVAVISFLFLITAAAIAADMDPSSHGHEMKGIEKMDTMDHMDDMNSMDNMNEMMDGDRKGELIRETDIEGYHLAYHLIDMQEQMKQMKAAGHTHEMDMTHHLMVYVTDETGAPVGNATVGYLVQNPDGAKQKAMCMAMTDGFGSDINFSSPGTYEVKTKIVVGDKTVMDTFEYASH